MTESKEKVRVGIQWVVVGVLFLHFLVWGIVPLIVAGRLWPVLGVGLFKWMLGVVLVDGIFSLHVAIGLIFRNVVARRFAIISLIFSASVPFFNLIFGGTRAVNQKALLALPWILCLLVLLLSPIGKKIFTKTFRSDFWRGLYKGVGFLWLGVIIFAQAVWLALYVRNAYLHARAGEFVETQKCKVPSETEGETLPGFRWIAVDGIAFPVFQDAYILSVNKPWSLICMTVDDPERCRLVIYGNDPGLLNAEKIWSRLLKFDSLYEFEYVMHNKPIPVILNYISDAFGYNCDRVLVFETSSVKGLVCYRDSSHFFKISLYSLSGKKIGELEYQDKSGEVINWDTAVKVACSIRRADKGGCNLSKGIELLNKGDLIPAQDVFVECYWNRNNADAGVWLVKTMYEVEKKVGHRIPGLDFLLYNIVQQHPDNAEARKMYEEREKEKRLED